MGNVLAWSRGLPTVWEHPWVSQPCSPAGRAACWRWPHHCAGSWGGGAAPRDRRWHWHPAGTRSSLQTQSRGCTAAGHLCTQHTITQNGLEGNLKIAQFQSPAVARTPSLDQAAQSPIQPGFEAWNMGVTFTYSSTSPCQQEPKNNPPLKKVALKGRQGSEETPLFTVPCPVRTPVHQSAHAEHW